MIWSRNGSLRLPIKELVAIIATSLLWGFLDLASKLLSIASIKIGHPAKTTNTVKAWGHCCEILKTQQGMAYIVMAQAWLESWRQ
jgi:hypothetical protein